MLVADALGSSPETLPSPRASLATASAQPLWLGATGAVVTGIFAYGPLVRNRRKVVGLGRDSLLVLVTYLVAVALLTAVPG